jgi:hypothetical protein
LVTVQISVKIDGIEMPNLVGRSKAEAIAILNSIKYLTLGDYYSIYVASYDNFPIQSTKDMTFEEAYSHLYTTDTRKTLTIPTMRL